MTTKLREPLSVGAPKTNGSGLAFDNPVLVNVTDPETHVEYVLHVQINHWGGLGMVRIESSRLWIGQGGFDVDLVQDDHLVTDRAGDFIRRKLMPQIMEAIQRNAEAENLISSE